ncbi:hypothetical protein vseg_003156 [Gypsophila vaccaria]
MATFSKNLTILSALFALLRANLATSSISLATDGEEKGWQNDKGEGREWKMVSYWSCVGRKSDINGVMFRSSVRRRTLRNGPPTDWPPSPQIGTENKQQTPGVVH